MNDRFLFQLNQKTTLRLTVLGFALFLLLFSSFAEYHVYANDEITDAHGCQIGLWVQHGKTAILAVVFASAALGSLFFQNQAIKKIIPKPFRSTASLRAPPYSLL